MNRSLAGIVVILTLASAVVSQGASPSTFKLYVAYEGNSYGVFQSDLDGSNAVDLPGVAGYCVPIGIAIDSQHGKMYLACTSPGMICSANLNGSGVKNITPTDITELAGVAVDPSAGYLYWTVTEYGGSVIKRANLDGSNPITLIGGLSSPEGISLDLVNGKIYWTDYNLGTVKRANLNGTGVQTIETNGGRGVAVDPQHNKIYWAGYGKQTGIWEANLNGTNPQLILSQANIHYPFDIALDVPDGKLYFTDSISDHSVWEANLDGTNLVQLPGNYSSAKIPYGVAVYTVPEPSTTGLLAAGSLCILGYVWRLRRKQ